MENNFWKIVATGQSETGKESKIERMKKTVAELRLSNQEVIGLLEFALKAVNMLDNAKLHGASQLFWGHLPDDSFTDHRRWIVSLGPKQFNLAKQDPDTFYCSIVDQKQQREWPFFESFLVPFTNEVYDRGLKVEFAPKHFERIPADQRKLQFPKLAEKLKHHQVDEFECLFN